MAVHFFTSPALSIVPEDQNNPVTIYGFNDAGAVTITEAGSPYPLNQTKRSGRGQLVGVTVPAGYFTLVAYPEVFGSSNSASNNFMAVDPYLLFSDGSSARSMNQPGVKVLPALRNSGLPNSSGLPAPAQFNFDFNANSYINGALLGA